LRVRLDREAPADLGAGIRDAAGWQTIPFDRFADVETILVRLRSSGCQIEEIEIGKPDLEDVFVKVMQGQGV
jgi:ABC-2 type transport system ATP-binding protein